jgi:hypothetical protein
VTAGARLTTTVRTARVRDIEQDIEQEESRT